MLVLLSSPTAGWLDTALILTVYLVLGSSPLTVKVLLKDDSVFTALADIIIVFDDEAISIEKRTKAGTPLSLGFSHNRA